MNTYRRTAIALGVLYIIGTVTGGLSAAMTSPILNASDTLTRVSAGPNQMITGALLILTMGLALALVPVVAFPILKKHHEALALGYVVFRGGLETVTYLAFVISMLLLVPVGQASVQAGALEASSFQPTGTLLLNAMEISATVTEIIFPLGALMFYYILYRSKLLPRWISAWGLVTAIPYLVAGMSHMFGLVGQWSTIKAVLVLPLAVQEMVMAVWLIVRGFNPPAIESEPAKAKPIEVQMSTAR